MTDTLPPIESSALKASALLLEWVNSGKDGFPDEDLLNAAVAFAKIAVRIEEG